MTTYSITTASNIDSLVTKTGGDIYNINGGTLNIDQDSRYGVNNAVGTGSMGSITISSTLGGVVNIDGRYVRLIPFTGGSGVVPNSNTTISIGAASGALIGVWSSLIVAPVAPGAAMPISGFIKIKAWNSVAFSAGALSGITASASGVDSAGWIDIVGDEAGTFTIPRLGTFNITGEWYNLGTTTGANTGTYQFPTSGLTTYLPGVWVETTVASNIYEFYPNAGTTTSVAANFSADWRSKVCWVSTAGVIRFGSDGTNSLGGFVPVVGCKIRIGNVILHNATTAARTANALPNATLATRYETATTSSGVIIIDKCACSWYLNCSQPYKVNLSNTGVFDAIIVSECATAMIWNQVGVGQVAANINLALTLALNFAGGTLTDVTLTSASLTAAGRYVYSTTDISGFTFTRLKSFAYAARGNATTGSAAITRSVNCIWNNHIVGSGRIALTTTTNCTFNNSSYFDNQARSTTATNPMFMFDLSTNCVNTMIDGIDFGGLYMTQPYNGLLQLGSAGCSTTKMRNVGSYASPISLGSPRRDDLAWSRTTTVATVTSSGHGLSVGDVFYVVVSSDIGAIVVGSKTVASVVSASSFTFTCLAAGAVSGTICYFGTTCSNLFVLGAGAAADGVFVQRVYALHTRTNLYTADNSSKNITLNNVFSAYFNAPLTAMLNGNFRNVSCTPPLTAQTAVYGIHWFNVYVCDVATNTISQSYTRATTVCTITSVGHSLRTGMTITVNSSAAPTTFLSSQYSVSVLSSSTFTIVVANAGAASGSLTYKVANGRIGLLMNEASPDTTDRYIINTGNPVFTSAGGLYMPTIGDQITFTTPEYIIGQGATFPIFEGVMGGGTISDYDIKYAIDKNDAAGYSAFKNLCYSRLGGSGTAGQFTFTLTSGVGVAIGDYVSGTGISPIAKVTAVASNTITVDTAHTATVSGIIRFNQLPNETGISTSLGIKLKWQIKTTTANLTPITSLYIQTESNGVDRAYQYALESNTIVFTGLYAGTDVVILSAGTNTILTAVDQIPGNTYTHTYSGAQTVDVGFIKTGYVPQYIRNLSLGLVNSTLPIALVTDRNFI